MIWSEDLREDTRFHYIGSRLLVVASKRTIAVAHFFFVPITLRLHQNFKLIEHKNVDNAGFILLLYEYWIL